VLDGFTPNMLVFDVFSRPKRTTPDN